MKVAIVGASGMVGKMFVQVIEERQLPIKELYLIASSRSAGQTLSFCGNELQIEELTPAVFDRGIDYALFAASNDISRKYAPIAVKAGCVVIDNSSAWRMDPDVPLVVPEVNGADLANHKGIIANPNCCATPAVIALKPLHDMYVLKRVVISTYQSVSGAGVGGMQDLDDTMAGNPPGHFPYPIAHNVIPHIDRFLGDGYTGEERKLISEIRKMLHSQHMGVTATTVRVPVKVGHSLSINVTFENPYVLEHLVEHLAEAPGIVISDDPAANLYPMPITAAGTDMVYVGRIRRDNSLPHSLNMWVSADNIRKGAATNAVQILEMLTGLNPEMVKSTE